MIRLSQIRISIEEEDTDKALYDTVCRKLRIDGSVIKSDIKIVKKSLDARKKPDLFHIFTVDVDVDNEEYILKKSRCRQAVIHKRKPYVWPEGDKTAYRPIIIGMGPAGLFCGYMLAMAGCKPILCDRGCPVDERTKDVERFWKDGILDTGSNVQFGEGGAGTFSDGKLNTLVNDRNGRNGLVLKIFVENGAPEEILYESKPHIGTDILRDVVASMRHKIEEHGGEYLFEHKLTDIVRHPDNIEAVFENGTRLTTDSLVLAIGHSARDTFGMLLERGLSMSPKSFAVGLRVLHPQEMIDEAMYGRENLDKGLPPASYKLTYEAADKRGVYSFCMCPGGYVVDASSEDGRKAINGMSYSRRDSGMANSGIIVTVTPDDYGDDDALAGVRFQQKLEKACYELGDGCIPVQTYPAYAKGTIDAVDIPAGGFKGSIKNADLSGLLPSELRKDLIEGMEYFERIIPGFTSDRALMAGIESRTSSPVRIHRDESGRAEGDFIYPSGEGAGYAGGITSAAMDGIYIAEEIWKKGLTR